MIGYIKCFEDGGKNMSYVTDDEEVYEKYNEIWEVVRKLLKLKFTVNPIRDDKYIIAKLKIFNGTNRMTFTDNIDNRTFTDNRNIDIDNIHYIDIDNIHLLIIERHLLTIDIDSVLKIDNKRAYPQAYLEQCKYKLRKRKPVNFIDFEIIDDSDSDIDSAVDSHNNFSVPDSYNNRNNNRNKFNE